MDEKLTDKQIGTFDKATGATTFPALDFNGNPYNRPATQCFLDESRFVIVPVGFTAWDKIEALRAPAKPAVPEFSAQSKPGLKQD